MNSIYSEQILADKLSKLNSTQQCIETLSHWCIFHRSKAESVVTTWDKQFHKSEMAQKVPLLYLANDILQNSKRKGNEFVTEFWKVLPAALKDVYEKGDDHGKNVVSRLVGIWGERRVFGSRGQSLKDVMLGEELPPPLEFSKKRSRSVRIVKRDSRSIRTKLTIGGAAEKIVSAFHLVISEHPNEDEEMSKCKTVVHRVRKMEKDVDLALTKVKDPKRMTLNKELEEEEELLKQSIQKLKVVEANRLALVTQLREALHEQESELENVRTQMQVAQAQAEEASIMRKKLKDENYVSDSKPSPVTPPPIDANSKPPQTPKKTPAAIAAEVADRLAASSSSQYIMSSVLSTFAAEEAKNAGLTTASTVSSNPVNNSTNNNSYQSVFVSQATMQNQIPNSQAQYQTLSNPHSQQQYLQQPPPGGVVVSYGYSTIPQMPPPVPPPSYMVSPMVPLTHQTMQMGHQQSAPNLQQQPMHLPQQPMHLPQQPMPPPSFRPLVPMQPPGMMYYTLPHQSQ